MASPAQAEMTPRAQQIVTDITTRMAQGQDVEKKVDFTVKSLLKAGLRSTADLAEITDETWSKERFSGKQKNLRLKLGAEMQRELRDAASAASPQASSASTQQPARTEASGSSSSAWNRDSEWWSQGGQRGQWWGRGQGNWWEQGSSRQEWREEQSPTPAADEPSALPAEAPAAEPAEGPAAAGAAAEWQGPTTSGGEKAVEPFQATTQAFGTTGRPVPLVANHFVLSFESLRERQTGRWLMWQVEFPLPAFATSGKGAAGKGGAQVKARELGRERRRKVVEALMRARGEGEESWVYDGRHRLYTLPNIVFERKNHEVSMEVGRPRVVVEVTKALSEEEGGRQQELDLSRLAERPCEETCKEELRFLNVTIRHCAASTASSSPMELICSGRKVINPGLMREEDRALLHGRQIWFGFLAQLEIINTSARSNVARVTLNLNLCASVGLPQMDAIELLAYFLSEKSWKNGKPSDCKWSLERGRADWRELLPVLNTDTGFKGLKVGVAYPTYTKKGIALGVDKLAANERKFAYTDEHGNSKDITVADYFKNVKKQELWYPHLPCVMVGKHSTYIPMEIVKVLGGDHNILVGKLKDEYQQQVTKQTAMPPGNRMRMISDQLLQFPKSVLEEKGLKVAGQKLHIQGRVLDQPMMKGSSSASLQPNRWAGAAAAAPPQFEVPWAIWCFDGEVCSDAEIADFARYFQQEAGKIGMRMRAPRPNYWPDACWQLRPDYWNDTHALKKAMLEDLSKLLQAADRPMLLVVLLPGQGKVGGDIRGLVKTLCETEPEIAKHGLATQCIKCLKKKSKDGYMQSGLEAAKNKLNLLDLKLVSKLPRKQDCAPGSGAAHMITIPNIHPLLKRNVQGKTTTMVMGADVTHNAMGVSVAGVTASRSGDFATYFSEACGQEPFANEGEKTRRRKSEECILQLTKMTARLLRSWQRENGALPETILYYRDGVSDGQFKPVLEHEHYQLVEAFKLLRSDYKPKLVIIVGQKRHQTRLWKEGAGGGGKDGGKGGGKDGGKGKGKGKGKGGYESQVDPGTVAGEGIAQMGHMNFFLVAQQGIQGTAVPCHYHVLHLDSRLGIGINDVENITYQLCHLYPRADKTVSYATPAYLADHVCERGKLYLETLFAGQGDVASLAPSGSSNESLERKLIQERVEELNRRLEVRRECKSCHGLNFFC